MQNFTISKNAQIIDVNGLVQAGSLQNSTLEIGDRLAPGTVLNLAQGSEVSLVFDDGSEQKITAEPEALLTSDAQTIEPSSLTALAQSQNQTTNESRR